MPALPFAKGLVPGLMGGLGVVAGVFLGSAGWWAVIAFAASRMRGRLRGAWCTWVNRLSGAALAGFGGLAVLGSLASG